MLGSGGLEVMREKSTIYIEILHEQVIPFSSDQIPLNHQIVNGQTQQVT